MCEVDVCWQNYAVGGDLFGLHGGWGPGVVAGQRVGPRPHKPSVSLYAAQIPNSSATSVLSSLDLLRGQRGKGFSFTSICAVPQPLWTCYPLKAISDKSRSVQTTADCEPPALPSPPLPSSPLPSLSLLSLPPEKGCSPRPRDWVGPV